MVQTLINHNFLYTGRVLTKPAPIERHFAGLSIGAVLLKSEQYIESYGQSKLAPSIPRGARKSLES